MTAIILILFPGLLFFYLPISKKIHFFEAVIFAIALSLSFWISGFWILKFLPLSFTTFIYLSVALSLIIAIFKHKASLALPSFKFSDLFSFFLVIFLFLLFIPLYHQQVAPAGADMASHSYLARLIQEHNGFPKSYEPIVPVRHFGAAPFGFSTLVAAISLLSDLPIYRSALLLTSFTYPLFGIALFVFLKNYFSLFVSSLTTLLVLLIGSEITSYLTWGGNPTILSIAFLLFGLAYGLRISQLNYLSPKYIVLLSLLFYTSFTIHHIPFVNVLFFVPAIGFYLIFKKSHRRKYLPFLGYLFLFLFILAVPFFLSLKLPSETTIEWVKSWQRRDCYWVGNWQNAYRTIPLYIQGRIGKNLFAMLILGLFSSFFIKMKHKFWFFAFLLLITIIILNSRYWFLPLSPLLYPDRAVSVGVVSMAFFVGCLFHFCLDLIQRITRSRLVSIVLLLVFLAGPPIHGQWLISRARENYEELRRNSASLSSITQDDINAFHWISDHTTIIDVFDNNYGDAGIWIPAIAYRKVIANDASPYDFDELEKGVKHLTPSYVYIGSKTVYPDPDAMFFFADMLKKSPNHELVYSSGNALVYKIKKQED